MKNILRNKHLNFLIMISFVIISIVEIMYIWPHYILNGNDFYFHLERLEELAKTKSIFTGYAFNSFSDNGSAVMTMYPYLLLYPFAILIKFFGHIHFVIYLMYISNIFLTLLISYFSSLSYTRENRLVSYIFSLIYSLSYEYIALNFWSSDFGMSWSATFMPLILFGFIIWLNNNKWLMLSIGMSFIIYSNEAVAIFTPILLFVWLIFNYRLINKRHIITLFKAVISTLLITSLFWLPAVRLLLLNNHFIGNVTLSGGVGEVSPKAIVATILPWKSFTFNNWFPWELTIPSLLGLIISTVLFKHLNHTLRQFYLFSLFIIILSSSFFIWKLPVMSKIGGLIQQTIRMYLIPQILLTYLFSVYISKVLYKMNGNKKVLAIVFTSLFIILFQCFYINIFHKQQSASQYHANGYIITSFFYNHYSSNPSNHIDYYIGTNHIAYIISHGDGLANKKKIHFSREGNGKVRFYIPQRTKYVSLPMLCYKGTNYKCYLDHKLVNPYKCHHLITIKNINKGTHQVNVNVKKDYVFKVAFVFTLLGVFLYLFILLKFVI